MFPSSEGEMCSERERGREKVFASLSFRKGELFCGGFVREGGEKREVLEEGRAGSCRKSLN